MLALLSLPQLHSLSLRVGLRAVFPAVRRPLPPLRNLRQRRIAAHALVHQIAADDRACAADAAATVDIDGPPAPDSGRASFEWRPFGLRPASPGRGWKNITFYYFSVDSDRFGQQRC
jgi:hypothetical protein